MALLVVEVASVGQLHGAEEELRRAFLGLLLVFGAHLFACVNQGCGLRVLCHQQVAQMTGQTGDEVLPLEALRENLVEREHALRYLAFHTVVSETEVIVVVEHVQVLDGALIGDVATTERSYLVEDAQCVAHASIGFLRNDVQCRILSRNAFFLCHILQVSHDVVHTHALEVVNLASAHDGGQNLMLLGGGKNEDGMLRRFFQCLQEGIEGGL